MSGEEEFIPRESRTRTRVVRPAKRYDDEWVGRTRLPRSTNREPTSNTQVPRTRRVSKHRMLLRSRREMTIRRSLRSRSCQNDQRSARALQRAARLRPWPKPIDDDTPCDEVPLYDDTLNDSEISTVPYAYHQFRREWLSHFMRITDEEVPSAEHQKSVINRRLKQVISTMEAVLQAQGSGSKTFIREPMSFEIKDIPPDLPHHASMVIVQALILRSTVFARIWMAFVASRKKRSWYDIQFENLCQFADLCEEYVLEFHDLCTRQVDTPIPQCVYHVPRTWWNFWPKVTPIQCFQGMAI